MHQGKHMRCTGKRNEACDWKAKRAMWTHLSWYLRTALVACPAHIMCTWSQYGTAHSPHTRKLQTCPFHSPYSPDHTWLSVSSIVIDTNADCSLTSSFSMIYDNCQYQNNHTWMIVKGACAFGPSLTPPPAFYIVEETYSNKRTACVQIFMIPY